MPAHVQISLLRRMPLLPGGAVMTLSTILLTTRELTSPFLHEHDIQIKLLIENNIKLKFHHNEYQILLSRNQGTREPFDLEHYEHEAGYDEGCDLRDEWSGRKRATLPIRAK